MKTMELTPMTVTENWKEEFTAKCRKAISSFMKNFKEFKQFVTPIYIGLEKEVKWQ